MNRMELAGKKFGKLTVLSFLEMDARSQSVWTCSCDCGETVSVLGSSLTRRPGTKSCGCLQPSIIRAIRGSALTHGAAAGAKTAEYRAWQSMKARCSDGNLRQYADYAGRGITVCGRWINSFKDFLADMGAKPSPGHSLDRVDNDRGYDPENCRWATQMEQMSNTRKRRIKDFPDRTIDNEFYRRKDLQFMSNYMLAQQPV